jgi:FtsZ-interacting cell division protein ZipA
MQPDLLGSCSLLQKIILSVGAIAVICAVVHVWPWRKRKEGKRDGNMGSDAG